MKTSKTITVTGATGNIGSKLVTLLLQQGAQVRAIARDAKKLKGLADQGAKVFNIDLTDVEKVAEVMRGSDAVFALIPPHYGAQNFRQTQNIIGDALARAIVESGVKHVVNLSSLGAELSDGTGPIRGLYDQEQRLNKVPGLNVLHLRPAYFMENIFFSLELAKTQGIIGTPVAGEVRLPQIATQDIASAAAEELTELNFSGQKVRELIGPQDVSMNELASALGTALGKTALPYVQFPYEAAREAMIGSGLSADVADNFNQMYLAFNNGRVAPLSGRRPEITTSTTLKTFLASAINS